MRLLANMVVRNESDKYLHRVLTRLKTQVDEIIVTDDCSDDDTPNIAESYGAHVFQMTEPTFAVHEGRLRQASWDHFMNFGIPGDYCLAIDADEELYETTHSLRRLISHPQIDVFNIMFYHMWSETHYRVDKAWKPHGSTRLFRVFEGGTFKQSALACGSEPSYVQDLIQQRKYYIDSGLKMKHLSYIKDEDKQNKYERYSKIDGGAFHAGPHIQSIIDPLNQVTLEEWIWE